MLTVLETVGVELCDASKMLKATECKLPQAHGETGERNIISVFEWNLGYSIMPKSVMFLREK